MKTKIFFLIIGIAFPIISSAGNFCPGIYTSAIDYQRNIISIVADTAQCKNVKINEFFFHPYLWIHTKNAKQKVMKNNIFAIRMYDGKLYRIVNNDFYLLLDSSNI